MHPIILLGCDSKSVKSASVSGKLSSPFQIQRSAQESLASGIWIHRILSSLGPVRSGHLTVQHSGAPLHSVGAGRRAPPSPGSETRVWQHHRGCNNNPTLRLLLGQRDTTREAGEGEGTRTGQARGLRLGDDRGVVWVTRPSVCMASRGIEGDVSPEGEWAMRMCRSV